MYSIVIPCYKSGETIAKVVEETAAEMNRLGRSDFEFVLVNDCSPDGGKTIAILEQLARKCTYVKVIDLAKNVGQPNAVMAGLRNASGDVFISMDDDMQTRPSELPKLFEAFDGGFDVVYAAYPEKKENLFRLFGSWVNKMCAVYFIKRPKDLSTSSFWVMRKYVRDSIIEYRGPYSYLLGLILRATSHVTCVPVNHYERETGRSGYTFRTLLGLWSNMIGFTVRPLHLAMKGGLALAFISLLAMMGFIIRKIMYPSLSAGWASTMASIYFSLGILLFFLGMIGEYVGRMYLHINSEPQYVIRNKMNFGEDSQSGPKVLPQEENKPCQKS